MCTYDDDNILDMAAAFLLIKFDVPPVVFLLPLAFFTCFVSNYDCVFSSPVRRSHQLYQSFYLSMSRMFIFIYYI